MNRPTRSIATSGESLAEEDRTASTPAPLKGSLIVIACTQTIDRIVKEGAEGSIPPPTRSAGATRPKKDETPAACSQIHGWRRRNGPRGPLPPPCSQETNSAGDSSVAFRVGVITSDKGSYSEV